MYNLHCDMTASWPNGENTLKWIWAWRDLTVTRWTRREGAGRVHWRRGAEGRRVVLNMVNPNWVSPLTLTL